MTSSDSSITAQSQPWTLARILNEDHGVIEQWLEMHQFDPNTVRGNGGVLNKRNKAKIYLADRILDMIEKYGETGFGNKPENTDVVLYWLLTSSLSNVLQQRWFVH
jgi:hypothetical protein